MDAGCEAQVHHRYAVEVTLDGGASVRVVERISVTNPTDGRLGEVRMRIPPDVDPASIAIEGHRVQTGATTLRVPLRSPVATGGSVDLIARYTVNVGPVRTAPPDDPADVLRVGDVTMLGDFLLIVPPWDPVYGFRTHPRAPFGDDHFYDPADFRVTVDAPPGWVLAATGEQLPGSPTFEARGARTFALAACRGCERRTRDIGGVRLQTLESETLAHRVDLDAAAAFVSWATAQFGPLAAKEIDIVALSDATEWWGVEYPGLISLVGLHSSVGRELLTHELAHQWWYAEVGNDANLHPFVDEALATWSTVAFSTIEGHDSFFAERMAKLGAASTPRRISDPRWSYERSEYFDVVYAGGAAMWHEVRSVEPDAFDRAVRGYLELYRCRNAGPTALVDLVIAESTRPNAVRDVWVRWTGQRLGAMAEP